MATVVHKIVAHAYRWAGTLGRRYGRPPYIVLHYSDSGPATTVSDIDSWHKARGWLGIGYHAVIYPSGEIVRGRPVWAMGAHCLTHNDCLGICFISMTGSLTPNQVSSGRWLVCRWRKRFGVPKSRVKRHKDMSNNSTDCPGPKFPFSKVVV